MKIDNNMIELVDIYSKEYKSKSNMIDIQVQDDESFMLGNGLISHNSAVGEIMNARDPSIHGAMELKGKILNVSTPEGTVSQENSMKRKVIQSEGTSNIMNSIGLVIGEEPEWDKLRYGTLYLALDADQDGFNIMALICNFLYKYWPSLFDINPLTGESFVQVFTAPLLILTKGKSRKYFYPDNIEDFDHEDYKGWSVLRAKGLGSMDSESWQDHIDHIRSIPLIDDGSLEETLDLIFNNSRSDDRKEWMSNK